MTRVITFIEKETRYRARGRVCGQEEAEASFKWRRSEHARLLPPDTFIEFYGDDFGPDAWFVGLYLDELVKPPTERPDLAEYVIYGLIAVLCIAVFAGVSAMLAQ